MSLYKPIERILLTKENFLEIENTIRLQEHLRRYAAIRRFIYGKVLDFACGCGYGTHLISTNPEIIKVVGVDKDEESINWAKKEFETSKCNFLCEDVSSIKEKFDTLVSLETIEHFNDNTLYENIIKNCEVDQIIISYPNKKSTHFNPFHVRDLNRQEICNIFSDYILYHSFVLGDVDFMLFIRKPKTMPSHIFLNINDLR